jgi:uncharacterized membrane protein YhhN
MSILIVGFAAILLILLLYAERSGNPKRRLPVKTALSFLFILIALIQPPTLKGYFLPLCAGLILCLAGDVFLALPDRFFKAGLVAFLFGHVFYIVAFAAILPMGQWLSIGGLFFLILSGCVFLWLRPHLGAMGVPVSVYVLVITAMVSAAWAVYGKTMLPISGRALIFIGAVSFYFSDIFVARNQFMKKEFVNRAIGLPLYYTGQFLLAFSPGFLG